MDYPRRSQAGPYELAILGVVESVTEHWWLDPTREIAVGYPHWLAARLAEETRVPLNPPLEPNAYSSSTS